MERLLAAGVLVLALLAPTTARADDYGPRRDIAAIRHDLPIVLQWSTPVVFDRIVVNGNDATVDWRSNGDPFISHLRMRYGRWWLLDDPPDPCVSPWDGTMLFQNYPARLANDGYHVGVLFAKNDAAADAAIVSFTTRAPTEAESWANPPSGNAYFFFSGTVHSAQPVHVQAGTTMDVWFPFVLDPSLRYSLTIAAPNALSLGPVEGTLKDNILRFVLPAFTAPPGAELMGEIDSD